MKHLTRFIASALMAMACNVAFAQTIEVSGTVVDELGETIIGATVAEKGTTNGTRTDLDGNFKLKIASGAKITVRYIGFQAQELIAEPGMKTTLIGLLLEKHEEHDYHSSRTLRTR